MKTVFIASMNPPRFVTWLVGSTSRIASTGAPYSSTVVIPARNTVNGTSRWGFLSSSPAVDGSSNPT